MKKIIYFLLLLINSVAFAQQPTIHPLEGGFTFENLTLDAYTSNENFNPVPTDCAFSTTYTYKFFSFKANFDMVFAFDLIARSSEFKFLVWKLDKNKQPTDVFVGRNSTIKADRSVQGTTNIKGMKEGVSISCESIFNTNATGYVKAFEDDQLLKNGETVIIGVYGGSNTDTFNIEVNVAEERTISSFDNLCEGQSYTYNQVLEAIKTDSGFDNIKLFTNNTFSNEISTATDFSTTTTVYAQVKDAAGNLKYIYTVPLKFIPEHQFSFKTSIPTEFACTNSYIIPDENTLLSKLFVTVLAEYKISSITIDGNSYNVGDSVPLNTGEEKFIKIKVRYNGDCPVDSNEITIPLKQGSPILSNNISAATCDNTYQLLYTEVYSKLGEDASQYDLEITLNGNPVANQTTSVITTSLTYKVKIKSKSSGCISNEVDFVVTKTSPATIENGSINGICLDDFSQLEIDNAISTIQNGNSYQLRFFQENGTELVSSSLFNYIKNNKTGKIIVKALSSDNSGICDTTKELSFNLNQSSFTKVENIETFKSSCSEVGLGYTFTKSEIESYLKVKLNRNDIIFSGINDVVLADNQSGIVRFKVQVNGELCWSEEMQLALQVITKPNLPTASKELLANCDNLVTINENTLKELFGSNSTVDYNYEILYNSTPLTFDTNGKMQVKVLFKNKLEESCSVEKTIIINRTESLDVDVALLDNYTKTNEIVYCENNIQGAKNQIQAILDYIKSQYPTLVSGSNSDQIFTQFNSANGFVEVTFTDPNYCGSALIKFYYQKNSLPTIVVPENGTVCSGELFMLDFTSQTNYSNYNYTVENNNGTKISGIDKFELNIGTYKITIEDKLTNCSVVKTLIVGNSELPTIDKITINQGNIIVVAKGNGSIDYALFDDKGNIIVNWQSNNTLIVPTGNINNNYTVKVRLNSCGVTEVTDLVYLDLPNFVSPNGDGKNDVWQPMMKNGQAADTKNSYKLLIFDRFGKQILIQEGVNVIKWDGTHLGKPVADGTYWYLLEFSKESNILNVKYSGSILVKRKVN